MPKRKYALERGGDKSLEIFWEGSWKNTKVRLNGNLIGTFPDLIDLEEEQVQGLDLHRPPLHAGQPAPASPPIPVETAPTVLVPAEPAETRPALNAEPTPTEVDEKDPGLPTAAADETRIGGGEVDRVTKLAAEPPESREPAGAKSREPEQVTLDSLDALVEFFITAGKRGVAINRYKGLGEMNPEQLWSTTMKPEARTLLQVHAEDHTEADLMFTTLMGDQVEPRRKFIEDNALDVKNLDI